MTITATISMTSIFVGAGFLRSQFGCSVLQGEEFFFCSFENKYKAGWAHKCLLELGIICDAPEQKGKHWLLKVPK